MQKSLTLQDYIQICLRRKWWIILWLIVGMSLAIGYFYISPSIYRSLTLILVEPQRIPSSYVTPTVTSSINERLNTLSQQILSRTNLEKIIKEFGLYEDGYPTTGLEVIKAYVKPKVKELLVESGLYESKESISLGQDERLEIALTRMREDIEVRVVGSGNAFTVAYSGPEPHTVMNVTNTLAAVYIQQNLKDRERTAETTSEFLASQLVEAEAELEKQEATLKNFKAKNMGALPEQLQANLRRLDLLHQEMQEINKELRSAEERKSSSEKQIQLLELSSDTPGPKLLLPEPPEAKDPREVQLEALRDRLANLRAQFKESYPDIALLKRQIHEVEEHFIESHASSEPVQSVESLKPAEQEQDLKRRRLRAQIQEDIRAIDADIGLLREKQRRTQELIREYDKKIEDTFANEQVLSDITRKYEISLRNYHDLLRKKLDAKLSENLEKKQKGEQFKILDPANLPQKPYKPNRSRIIFLGSAVGGGLGIGLVLLFEYLSPVGFRQPEDLLEIADLPILGTVPRNSITQKKYRLVAVEDTDSIITEQYRILSTKIDQFSKEKSQKVFAISSALPGEGKTVTTLNLAVVMARDFGKKTLLLEGDFKRPTLSHYLKTELTGGLVDILLHNTEFLSYTDPCADILLPFVDDNLSVLPAAKSVWNSSALLSSKRMKELLDYSREQYDYVLIDAPPILPLSDMNIFEEVVDGIILVVRAEKTSRDAVAKALEALATQKVIGFVLNDVSRQLQRYYRYAYRRI